LAKSLKLSLLTLYAIILAVQAAPSQTKFQHPGVVVSKAQLDFVKAQVNAKIEPFYSEYQRAAASPWGSLKYKVQGPYKGGVIQCGSHSKPSLGCKEVDQDSSAAYLQAVLWYITGNRKYAQNSIDIMNTYARTLKGFAGGTPGFPCPSKKADCSNAPLQAAWDTEKWPRAAEIIRYSNAGWAEPDARAFEDMLKKVYLPLIYEGSGNNGNWELSMIDGMFGIAVFTDDANLFQHAATFWRERVPAYYYYAPIDGPRPAAYPRTTGKTTWNGQEVFDGRVNGISQETCRDLHHTEYGIAATMNAAETAHIQGVKLFESEQPRLIAALEFNAGYELTRSTTAPSYVCDGKIDLGPAITYVIGYNEYHNRLGQPMPKTGALIENWVLTRPSPVDAASGPHIAIFEPLTHYADASSAKPGDKGSGASYRRKPLDHGAGL
jgi:hypothetical protein